MEKKKTQKTKPKKKVEKPKSSLDNVETKEVEKPKVTKKEEPVDVKKTKTEIKDNSCKQCKHKTQKTKGSLISAVSFLKSNNSCTGLMFAIVGFLLSMFVMLQAICIKAQTGIIVVALVALVTYTVIFALFAFILNFTALFISKNKLKTKKGLISFILALISLLIIFASVAIVYFS